MSNDGAGAGPADAIVSRWCFHCLHWPGALTGHPRRVEMCRVGHGQTNGFAGCAEWQHASIFAANDQSSRAAPGAGYEMSNGVLKIVKTHLERIGADGLCKDGCGCSVHDLAPCRSWIGWCTPARAINDGLSPGGGAWDGDPPWYVPMEKDE